MVVRIRLARFGKRHTPFYNIVVTHARTARNSKPLEVLGTFNPQPQRAAPLPLDAPAGSNSSEPRPVKTVQLDLARAKYWLGVGAQPSDAAWELLEKAGLLQPKLQKQEARWRAKAMDELFRKVEKGEINVKEMVTMVPTLQFVPEEAREGLVQRAPLDTEGRDVHRSDVEKEIK